jgi:hypothetical protein
MEAGPATQGQLHALQRGTFQLLVLVRTEDSAVRSRALSFAVSVTTRHSASLLAPCCGEGDGDGGLPVREGECTSLKARRWLLQRSGSNNTGAASIFKHISRWVPGGIEGRRGCR